MTRLAFQRFFWLFIVLHTVLWTLGPWMTRASLPHDTLESITWGMQWQWGYNKHPFLAAWLSAGIRQLLNATEWPVYLLAQLAVSTTFIVTWRFARQLLPPVHAMIAALSLEGVLYYNINSFNFTPDSLQAPLWALLTLFFYQATKTQWLRYWLVTGVMTALCIITKYQVIMLLLPMMCFTLFNRQARASIVKPGLYVAIAIMLLLIYPHLVWLEKNDFVTIRYALGAPYDHIQSYSHIACLFYYVTNCVAYVAGFFLLYWPFYRYILPRRLATFDGQFLLFIGIGPCILTAIFCFVHGEHIPTRWSTPYFFLIGVLMMAWLKPKLSATTLKQFAISLILFSGLLWGVRMSAIAFYSRMNSDAYLPNKAIALKLVELWHERYPTRLQYIAGTHYLIAATMPYMLDKPTPYFSWDLKESSWLNEVDLKQQGGIFVWDEGSNYFWDAFSANQNRLPDEIKQRFPDLIVLGSYTFNRLTPLPSAVTIGVALLPAHTS